MLRPLILLTLVSLSLPVSAEMPGGWDRFRGPDGRGITAGQLPKTWDRADYRWSVEVGGSDVGSMIGVGDDVVLMTSNVAGDQIAVTRIDGRSGKLVWTVPQDYRRRKQHNRSSVAQSTPATDGERIYAAWADADGLKLMAVGLDGQIVWTRDFGRWEGCTVSAAAPW